MQVHFLPFELCQISYLLTIGYCCNLSSNSYLIYCCVRPQPLLNKDIREKDNKQNFIGVCKHPKLIGNCSRLFQGIAMLATKILLVVRALFFLFN
jgi:hypothetical protein